VGVKELECSAVPAEIQHNTTNRILVEQQYAQNNDHPITLFVCNTDAGTDYYWW
jgi:hypothetical protein